MKICFANPWAPSTSWFFYAQGMSTPPVGMCKVASMLLAAGHEVLVVDGQATYEPPAETLARLQRWKPDLVAVMAQPLEHLYTFMSTCALPYHLRFAERLKEAMPEVPVVLGGIYASRYPETVLKKCASVDVVLTHHRTSLVDVAAAFTGQRSLEQVEGISFRNPDGQIRVTPTPTVHRGEYIDALPAFHLLDGYPGRYGIDKYLFLGAERTIRPVQPVLGSYGCPSRCSFCATPLFFGGEYHRRDPAAVVREIVHLHGKYGVDAFSVWDDTFTASAQSVRAICAQIIASGVNIRWWCFGRTEWVVRHPDLLGPLHQAGCRMMWLGVEAAEENQLKGYNKPQAGAHSLRAVELLRDHGIASTTSFIIGNVLDTRDSVRRLIDASQLFAEKGSVNVFTILVPIPGTPLHAELERRGLIQTTDLRLYNGTRAVLKYPNVDPEEVESLFFDAYRDAILGERALRQFGRTNFWDDETAGDEAAFASYRQTLLEGFDREKQKMLTLEKGEYF